MRYLLVLLSFFATVANGQGVYRNLVFEGGGIRGLAYAGTIKVLEEKNILSQVEKTAGTSAGAIAALLISLDYNATEIDSILRNIKFQKFNDGRGGLLGKYKRIRNYFGIYAGDKLEEWLGEIIEFKTGNPNLTFEGLHALRGTYPRFKEFYCTGTNLSQQRAEIFSYTSTPGFPLKTAVRISAAIPFYYKPVFLDSNYIPEKDPQPNISYSVMIDGGFIANFPITIFDSCIGPNGNPLECDSVIVNPATLGVKLERPEQIDLHRQQANAIAPFDIRNFNGFTHAFGAMMMRTMNYRNKDAYERDRTIYVSDGNMSPRVRKMTDKDKDLLVENGRKGAEDFFNNTQARK